jgi:hypothetical protein
MSFLKRIVNEYYAEAELSSPLNSYYNLLGR